MNSDEVLPREIRCVLVPAGELRLLLPNATIAEVITQSTPEPVARAPDWLLGRIAWRGWRVPLVSFTRLTGAAEGDAGLSGRVAVLKALGDNPRLPFIAVMTEGFPRLTTLNAELIIPTHDGSTLPAGVRAQVLVRDDVAVIPDLEWIEAELLDLLDVSPGDIPQDEANRGASTDQDDHA
ncbi:MAG: chemotaxis protein CheW [Rhodanobacter sp.]|nr:MAG: chemotaxis protein CheW [Rhodanobacter sp.]